MGVAIAARPDRGETLRRRLFGRLLPDHQCPGRDPAAGPRRGQAPLSIAKINRRSTVHRRVPMDAVAIKTFAKDGSVTGEMLFVGLNDFLAACAAENLWRPIFDWRVSFLAACAAENEANG